MAYLSPNSIESALEALQGDSFEVVAGCTDWFPAKGDKPAPQNMLDIAGIPEMRGISHDLDGWRFGAATKWADVARSNLPSCFDGLKLAACEIGSVQIQNAGTIGGNICNASPAADGVPPFLTLDAMVEIVSLSGVRKVKLADFITGVRKTTLRQGELVSALIVNDRPPSARSSFIKLGGRKYLVISIAMVAVVFDLDPEGQVESCAIAVGACSPVAQRQTALENTLVGLHRQQLHAKDLVKPEQLSDLSPISDVRGSAEFRIQIVAELCQRAIVAAAGAGRADG